MAVLTALAVKSPRPIREINPEVPPDLAGLVESLLQKDPALRPSSAQEVSDALGALEVCLPVLAGTEPDLIPSPPVPTRSTLLTPRARLFGQTPTATTSRRGLIAGIGIFAVIVILIAWFVLRPNPSPTGSVGSGGPPIRIGVLHSRTGTMAISERPVVDAVLLAVEEINAQGGLLGRPIQVVQQDGQSDESVFAREAVHSYLSFALHVQWRQSLRRCGGGPASVAILRSQS